MYPLDVVKTRLQLQTTAVGKGAVASEEVYVGVYDAFRKIIKQEGYTTKKHLHLLHYQPLHPLHRLHQANLKLSFSFYLKTFSFSKLYRGIASPIIAEGSEGSIIRLMRETLM